MKLIHTIMGLSLLLAVLSCQEAVLAKEKSVWTKIKEYVQEKHPEYYAYLMPGKEYYGHERLGEEGAYPNHHEYYEYESPEEANHEHYGYYEYVSPKEEHEHPGGTHEYYGSWYRHPYFERK